MTKIISAAAVFAVVLSAVPAAASGSGSGSGTGSTSNITKAVKDLNGQRGVKNPTVSAFEKVEIVK